MLTIAKTVAKHLPRHIKDRIPDGLKLKYHARLKEAQRGKQGEAETLTGVLESLKTVPFSEYMAKTSGAIGEYQELGTDIAALEINDSCNLDCAMCRTSEATRKKAAMDIGLFEEIVANLKERGIRTTNFHTIGDPTANKNLAHYLKVLRKHGLMITHLSSNCQMLDRHLDTIFEYRDIIHEFRPSIDAATKEVYERIRVRAKWEILLERLVEFARRNETSSNPFPVFINSVISKVNYHELAFIPSMFSFVTKPTNHTFALLKATGPATPYFMDNSYFGGDFLPSSPCRLFWGSPVILKDGKLGVCCLEYDGSTVFADFRDGDIRELFNNEKIRGFRKAHLEGNAQAMPELCKSCYSVDVRYAQVISGTIHRFYSSGAKHPVHLQLVLNRIGPLLKARRFDEVLAVIDSM